MQTFLVILFFLSLLALIIGLISPKSVIRWGSKRTRDRVFLTYGLAMIAFFVLIGVTGPPSEQERKKRVVAPTATVEQEEERWGLSEEKRKEIWKELILIERRAGKEAEERYPLDPTQSLRVGQVFQISKETPLMPELEPADPIAALQRMRILPPQTTIKIIKVAMKRQTPWYFVEAKSPSKASLGSGWINSIALMGQIDLKEQLKKQAELERRLKDKYEDELAKKYGLTREQLEKIFVEGIEKDWPFLKRR